MEFVLNRRAMSRLGLDIWQFCANTLRTPPDISLPIVTPPWPSFIWQSSIRMSSLGVFTRRPSAFLPDLIAMQSSPVSKLQSRITTIRLDSGSQPSLFGPWELIFTPSTSTWSDSVGCSSHIGEFTMVTSEMTTLLQRYGSMNAERR